MGTAVAGLHPSCALRWCLQGCTGVICTERTCLQAPPKYRAQLNLSRQPPATWLLMKDGYTGRGFHLRRAWECHWHRAHSVQGCSQHTPCASQLLAWGSPRASHLPGEKVSSGNLLVLQLMLQPPQFSCKAAGKGRAFSRLR